MNEDKPLTPEEKRRAYEKLPSEIKEKLIKPQLDLFTSAVSKKMGLLPLISTISAALIVLLTFNKTLINLEDIVWAKFILSIFLISIPITLFVFLDDTEKSAQKAREIIEGYTGMNLMRNIKHTYQSKFKARLPFVMIMIYFTIVAYFLWKMWQDYYFISFMFLIFVFLLLEEDKKITTST